MDSPSVLLPACANWTSRISTCKGKGTQTCGNCMLVLYCGIDCQRSHWPEHKKDCRSPMSKESWRPTWDREGRQPPWATRTASRNMHNPFGNNKYLWGNTPAIDILNLERNEGFDYPGDLALLFAASGDLRHVVKTIANLPTGLTQQIDVTLNDREFDVVARNAILLLLALTAQDNMKDKGSNASTETTEALMHVWYSAFIPTNVLSQLQDRVKPLIMEVCKQIANKASNSVFGKTWEFSTGQSLRLILKKKEWLLLQGFLDVPNNMTSEDAAQVRTAVTLAPERADYRDRWYYKDASPFMRIAKQRFQKDGLLLPFGHPRVAFKNPNPAFFYRPKSWPMDDKADPSNGWPIAEVQQTPSLAQQDWYGKLYIYLNNMLNKFRARLKESRLNFELYNVDVQELPQHLEPTKYSRIEVANICDGGYLGIRKTLSLLSPFMQSPRQNAHATFLTLFINAVKEAAKMGDPMDETPDMELTTEYLPAPQLSSLRLMNNSADMLRVWDARDLSLDVDMFFERYMKFCNFEQISNDLRMRMKEHNTIVEKWPTQLKLQIGQKGAKEEFRFNLGSNFANIERYVEWTRTE